MYGMVKVKASVDFCAQTCKADSKVVTVSLPIQMAFTPLATAILVMI